MVTLDFKITSDMKGMKDLEKHCRTLNKRHIRFGWYEGKKYPAGHDNAGLSIAQIANWQEYGVSNGEKNIPSRPYFRQTINKVKTSNYAQIKKIFLTGIHGNNIDGGLNKLAEAIVLEYQTSVAMQNHKRLSDYTVSMKGHNYQMYDSGVMMANFKARVYKQKQEHIKDS